MDETARRHWARTRFLNTKLRTRPASKLVPVYFIYKQLLDISGIFKASISLKVA